MKNSILKIATILVFVVAIMSCSKDGEPGASGPAGPAGTNGTNGTNGIDASIANTGFSVGGGFGGGAGTGQFFSSGLNTKVQFPNIMTNGQNVFSVTNNELTIPNSGFYHLTATVTFGSIISNDTPIILSLNQNASIMRFIRGRYSNLPSITITANVFLNANDKITVYLVQNSVATHYLTNNSQNTNFSGYRVY